VEPFRSELDAAHRRIAQLEAELAEARAPAAARARRRRVRTAAIVGGASVLGLAGFVGYRVSSSGSAGTQGAAVVTVTSSGEWEGVHRAILADADGNGLPDVVGRMRHLDDGDRITIAAFDGRSGKPLWKSESVGTYSDGLQGGLGLAGATLLFATGGGELRAYALRDGKAIWHVALPEKVKSYCAGDDPSEVVIRLADDAAVTVGLRDGRVAPGPIADAGDCKRLPDDGAERDSDDWGDMVGHSAPEGMRVSYAARAPGGGPVVLFGERAKGTSVPMIAAVYEDASRNWKADLPAERPLESSAEPFGAQAAVTTTRAFATYQRPQGSDPHLLVCFDLAGRRQWEKPLPDSDPLTSVQAIEERVFVSQWGHLTAYDARTGEIAFSIGKPR
jgi:outer membrane protein assembly factor BamB